MKKLLSVSLLALSLAGFGLTAHAFSLSSKDIRPGRSLGKPQVFKGFDCNGDNQAPQLSWKNPPKGTKSFAITVYDPDAPTGSGWWHWVVYDIPASVSSLPSGVSGEANAQVKLPEGIKQGKNDYGIRDFGGVCPPIGDKPHRYIFTVHALKVNKLNVPEDASPALIGFTLHANSLGKASFTAKYGR